MDVNFDLLSSMNGLSGRISAINLISKLYGCRDMYNVLHKEQLHVSVLFIGHLQVDK